MAMPQTIDALYAWVATERDGSEGVAAVLTDLAGERSWMPLVGADVDRVKSFRSAVEDLKKATGLTIRLVRYSRREDLEEI